MLDLPSHGSFQYRPLNLFDMGGGGGNDGPPNMFLPIVPKRLGGGS